MRSLICGMIKRITLLFTTAKRYIVAKTTRGARLSRAYSNSTGYFAGVRCHFFIFFYLPCGGLLADGAYRRPSEKPPRPNDWDSIGGIEECAPLKID